MGQSESGAASGFGTGGLTGVRGLADSITAANPMVSVPARHIVPDPTDENSPMKSVMIPTPIMAQAKRRIRIVIADVFCATSMPRFYPGGRRAGKVFLASVGQ